MEQIKKYAHENDVKIIGDMPIYVAMDSADVWASPENFQLDGELNPTEVAGVPPDYFSEEGSCGETRCMTGTYACRWVRMVDKKNRSGGKNV